MGISSHSVGARCAPGRFASPAHTFSNDDINNEDTTIFANQMHTVDNCCSKLSASIATPSRSMHSSPLRRPARGDPIIISGETSPAPLYGAHTSSCHAKVRVERKSERLRIEKNRIAKRPSHESELHVGRIDVSKKSSTQTLVGTKFMMTRAFLQSAIAATVHLFLIAFNESLNNCANSESALMPIACDQLSSVVP